MARAAVKAKQAQAQKARPAPRRGRPRVDHANKDLFFQRLRRRAKWAYVLLAVLFAITFAFVGVGTGSNGGLDQLFQGLNIFHHNGKSVSSAQKEVLKNPTKGYRDLATVFEAKGDTDQAITALQSYTGLKPKDAKAWTELANLQLSQAADLTTQYQSLSTTAQLSAPGATFTPTGKLANVFHDPIETAVAGQLNTQVNGIAQRVSLAYQGAESSYEKVTGLQPKSSAAWFQLANTAQNAGDSATAVKAYKKYLALNPGSANAAQIKALIKSLQTPAK